jgi:uncharacterized protein (DUF1778 family)
MGIHQIMIDLTESPSKGLDQMLVRCRTADKNDVRKAADMLGITQAEFMRTVIVQCARKVIQEYGNS